MKVTELKRGMKIVFRNGRTRVVESVNNKHFFINEHEVIYVTPRPGLTKVTLREDMTNEVTKGLDVIEVYDLNVEGIYYNIWTRDEVVELTVDQVSERLGYEVKIIGGEK